jgi:hypothetical protein
VTIWAHVCLDPTEEAVQAAKRFVSAYVRVPGYDRNFVRQGFGDLVNAAKAAPSVREVRAMIPEQLLVESLGFGTRAEIRARLDAYRELGVEIALVPATTVDPGARRTLAALAS